MNRTEIINIAQRYWLEDYRKYMPVPPEARVITGRPYQDAFLHHMLVENGVELIVDQTPKGHWVYVNHRVVDEHKFTMFVLRRS